MTQTLRFSIQMDADDVRKRGILYRGPKTSDRYRVERDTKGRWRCRCGEAKGDCRHIAQAKELAARDVILGRL